MSRRRVLATAVATALLSALVGGYVTPAQAAPVLAADTLKSGAVYAFGANDKGQTNPASTSTTQLGAAQLPNGAGGVLKDAVSIAAGKGFTSWVDHLGQVWMLGDNTYGIAGNGTTGGTKRTPTKANVFGASGQPKAVKVSAYNGQLLVLDDAGAVWQWGFIWVSTSQCTQATPLKLTFPSGTTRIVDISTGDASNAALDDGGRAYSWGKNDKGQLGIGTTTTTASPTRITGLPTLPSGAQPNFEIGRDFGVYTISSSAGVQIYTWGRNFEHELGNGSSTTDTKSPALLTTTVPAPAKVLALSAGAEHTLLLTNDGAIRWWGDTEVGNPQFVSVPTVVADPAGVLTGSHHPYTVAAGDGASFAANTDGTVVAWGIDSTGQLGRTTTGTISAPTLISVPGTYPASAYGTPALITSRQGSTYVQVDSQLARTPQAAYDFGSFPTTAAPGQTAPKQTITFTNVSNKPIASASLTVDGANPGDFTLSANTCTGTVAVDGTCSVTVTFQPTANGARAAGVILRGTNTAGGLLLQAGFSVTGRGYAPVATLANFKLDVASGSPTTVSGPGNSIDLRSLDPSLIPQYIDPAASSTSLGKVPIAGVSLGKVLPPLPSLGKVSLGKVPVTQLSLGKVPFSISLGKVLPPLPSLGKVSLGKVPLLRDGGWSALLSAYPKLANAPISSLTLADVTDRSILNGASTTAMPLERFTLDQVDLRNSAFARLSVLSLITAGLRLDQYPLDWCNAVLPKVPNGGSCNDGNGLQRTLFDLDLFNQVPIDQTGAGAVTVGQLKTDALSTTTNPVDDALFGQLLISSQDGTINVSGTRVGLIPLTSIPTITNVLTCASSYCTNLAGKTLGDAQLAGQIRSDATYTSLGSALNGLTLASLIEPYLDRSDFDWESLPVSSIPLAAYPNRIVLQADADINCASAAGTTLGIKLPAGFRYVPGTTTLTKTRGTGTVSLADPTADANRGLVVSVPDSAYSSTGAIQCTDDAAHLTVSMGVLPTSVAGPSYKATGDIRTTSVAPLTATQATGITVTGINQPPDDAPDGPLGAADQLIIGSVGANQVKYIPFHAGAAGRTIEVTVSNQTADVDATLLYPAGAPADPVLTSGSTATEVPFGEAPAGEPDALHPQSTIFGGALQDIPMNQDPRLATRPIAAVAATRGTDTEQLSAISRMGTNDDIHLLVISGYNAPGTFTARIRLVDAPTLPSCVGAPITPTTPPTTAVYGGGSVPSDTNTLVLVNRSRMEAVDSGTAAMLTSLDQFAHPAAGSTTGVKGAVLQVDSDAAVRQAYATWDASPCDPFAADGVVQAINAFVKPYFTSSIKNIVLVGGERFIPHARLEDHARDGSEREEGADVAFKGGNQLSNAFAQGYYLSDDPYGTSVAQTVYGLVLYVPQALPQRLGESAADIKAQVDTFIANNGVADPQTSNRTALVTDYDFLTAGGNETASGLGTAGYTVDHTLTNPKLWTRTDLQNAWLGRADKPSVAALNMHYDQYRGLPAAGNATGSLADVYQTSDVTAGSLDRRLVYTVGCHSALDIPDALADAGDPRALDWAQAYAKAGTAAMIGNLGFGYADTTAVAYSAKQQSYFTAGLAKGYDIGTALLEAKRTYVERLAGLSAYDVKSVQQIILWGLGAYRLKAAPAVQPAAAPVVQGSTDPLSQLLTTQVSVGTQSSPLTFSRVSAGGTSYDTATGPGGSGQSVSVPGRPVLPAQFIDLPQVNGKAVHGVVPLSFHAEQPQSGITATFARPGTDKGLDQQPLTVGTFPATQGHVGSAPGSGHNTYVYTPAEFQLDGTAPGRGTLQEQTYSTHLVTYGSATTPFVAVSVRNVLGTVVPASGSQSAATVFSADVTPGPGRTVRRVYVLAVPQVGYGDSIRVELAPDPNNPGHYSGAYLGGATGEFSVYALDDDGNYGTNTQKGLHYLPRVLPSGVPAGFPVQFSFPAANGANGWYTFDPTATLTGTGAGNYGFRVNGGPLQDSGSVVVGDGAQIVTMEDRTTGQIIGGVLVKIDKVTPTVQVVSDIAPTNRIELHEDRVFSLVTNVGASGIASQSDNGRTLSDGSRAFPSSTPGLNTLTATVTSNSGRTGTDNETYRVVYGIGSAGFAMPVANPGAGLNIVAPNLVYGYTFNLVDHFGAPVTTGAVPGNTVTYTQETCPSTTYKVQLPKITGATSQPVSGGGGDYTWDLQTPNSGVLVCDRMTVTANDGYTHFDADLQITP